MQAISRYTILLWYFMYLFLGFRKCNVRNTVHGIKSRIVVRFEEIAFHLEIIAVYILGYDVISIRVYQY